MKVRDVMEKHVICIRETDTYESAARTLYANGFSGAPVLDATGALIGMISEKDLFSVLFPYYGDYYGDPDAYLDYEQREHRVESVRTEPISRFMTKHVFTIEPDVPILRAGAIMLAKNVFRLPVVERGKVVGIVTRERIYQEVFRKYLGL